MNRQDADNIITVGLVALGCPKNVVDSEKMLARIGEAGFALSGDTDNVDVLVINTCGFIAPARDEAIAEIRRAVKRKKRGTIGKVIVAGCLSQRLGAQLNDEVKGIDAIIGLAQRDDIGAVVADVIGLSREGRPGQRVTTSAGEVPDDTGRLLITPAHWAYLRISEGCDRKCSFCTIPAIRGPFRSKPEDMVLREAHELVDNGAVELSIIAQDSNYYGRDLGQKNALVGLLKKLSDIDRLEWIRLMYLYPATIDDRLIETIASLPKVCRYIDMPIQHINDTILKKMRRSDSRQRTVELIERLRAAIDDVVLRTTVIVGFPGEDDAAFEELLEFIRWAQFDALGCFAFSAEEGTPAAELDGRVPQEIIDERLEQLMLTQQEIAFAAARNRIGSELRCLVDETDGRDGIGRFFGQAPYIDSICRIRNCTTAAGEFVTTRVLDNDAYDLLVEGVYD
jgi:ribosomal protein S12 methylthiotransferase